MSLYRYNYVPLLQMQKAFAKIQTVCFFETVPLTTNIKKLLI